VRQDAGLSLRRRDHEAAALLALGLLDLVRSSSAPLCKNYMCGVNPNWVARCVYI
jgi:hypothetical protein